MTRRAAKITQAEISRAIRAAAEMGPHVIVEIRPEGVIRISAPQPSEPVTVKAPKRDINL